MLISRERGRRESVFGRKGKGDEKREERCGWDGWFRFWRGFLGKEREGVFFGLSDRISIESKGA